MSSTLKKICDFIVRVIMMFTTILVLLFFSEKYSIYSFTFGVIILLYVAAIIVGGLLDIFSKEQ